MVLKRTKILNFSKDFILNLIASVISTGVMQLIVYPLLAGYMTSGEYGIVLTIMGISNTVAAACGGSLNNTRLLVNSEYEENNEQGDFSIILYGMTLISAILLGALLRIGYSTDWTICLLIVLITCLCGVRTYAVVEYRCVLNFKKILFSNIWVAVGNLLGILAFVVIQCEDFWPLPFLVGESLGIIYVLKSTTILTEKFKITRFFKKTWRKEGILLISSLSGNLLTYLDRLLLLPLLGSSAVSIYAVASVFGKSVGILMTPLAGVLLSYYAQKNFKMSRKLFWKINCATLVIGVLFLLFSKLCATWITSLFYPALIAQAEEYIMIANLTAIIGIIGNMTQTSVLKFAPTVWQLVVQVVYCGLYLTCGIAFSKEAGLQGFAVAALLASRVKLIGLYAGGTYVMKEEAGDDLEKCK